MINNITDATPKPRVDDDPLVVVKASVVVASCVHIIPVEVQVTGGAIVVETVVIASVVV